MGGAATPTDGGAAGIDDATGGSDGERGGSGGSAAGKDGSGGDRSGSGGEGGNRDAGAGGETNGGEAGSGQGDVVVRPSCPLDGGFFPVAFTPATSVAGSGRSDGGVSLFVTQPTTHLIAWAWTYGPSAEVWNGWLCFNNVPKPSRISVGFLSNGLREFFVTTSDGHVFVRREYDCPICWDQWLPFTLPSRESSVSDTFALSAGIPVAHVFLVDRGVLYGRAKETVEPYAPYGPWVRIGGSGLRRVTAVAYDQDIHLLAVRENQSIVSLTIPNLGRDPSPWSSVPTPGAIADVACGHSISGPLCYVTDAAGGIHVRGLTAGVWEEWQLVKEPGVGPRLTALTAIDRADNDALLCGVASNGDVYRLDESGDLHQILDLGP